MLHKVKKLIPHQLISGFHHTEAIVAGIAYRHPTKKMIVIGVVGSKGKTTLANLLWAALSGDGSMVGLIGTANIRIGQQEQMNPYHMTMPGRHRLQKTLAAMRDAGCQYAVMEVPSEGQAQWRHVGIYFDALIFTNVTRELMASHQYSLEILHQHNKRVFQQTEHQRAKTLQGRVQPKILIANADAEHFNQYFAHFADIKRSYSVNAKSNYKATRIESDSLGSTLVINKHQYRIAIPGIVNVSNATGAIATALELGKRPSDIARGLKSLAGVPGRMERIDVGQDFTVIVDYAHEETSMQALMDGAQEMKDKGSHVITLLGAEGGGRDEVKRPLMGEIAMRGSAKVVITNVDPYFDDPEKILDDIEVGIKKAKGKRDTSYWRMTDRREGIRAALGLAHAGDLVFITGKGSEQSMVVGGKKIPWDDRKVVTEELKKIIADRKKVQASKSAKRS